MFSSASFFTRSRRTNNGPTSGSFFQPRATSSVVNCEEAGTGATSSSDLFQITGAFTELGKGVPLNPKYDNAHHMGAHRWGYEKVPDSQMAGQRQHGELFDTKNHSTPIAPYPSDSRGFHAMPPSEDRINLSYENMLGDEMSLAPPTAGKFQSEWQKKIAYRYGLYQPSSMNAAKSADDIRLSVNEFSDKVLADDPKDACKYLLIEEYRCLQTYQYEKQPVDASKRCVKWYDEFQKCKWDQHKFNSGYTSVEGPALSTKRRPYIFYPDFKYA
ncbi:unnamed protein product [Amoebophrya sp. A120]|nr:unnamed protein product [Amoebophrya sp. A120]|eukprot:GSA120T00008989001.1